MQNVIWSNDTDRIDSIVDYWKEEAARLSEDMAKDPKGTIDDACWPVTDILDRAWRQAISDYELPTAARLIEIIEDLDPSATGIAAHAVDENNADRRDECGNLERLELGQPVVFVGTAGLWDGRRTIASIVNMDNIGDIIADSPWQHMEYETWSIDGHDDLRYTGVHHDGTNTCSVRELKEGRDIEPDDSLRDILRKTTPLGPRIRAVYGMPAPENTTKKNVEKPTKTT